MVGSARVWKRAISWKPDHYWRNCSERTGDRQPWRYSTWLVPNIGFGWIGATMALASVVKNPNNSWLGLLDGACIWRLTIGCGSNHGGGAVEGDRPIWNGPTCDKSAEHCEANRRARCGPVVSENTRLADNAPPLRMRLNPFTARTARLSVPTPVGFPSAGLRNVAKSPPKTIRSGPDRAQRHRVEWQVYVDPCRSIAGDKRLLRGRNRPLPIGF